MAGAPSAAAGGAAATDAAPSSAANMRGIRFLMSDNLPDPGLRPVTGRWPCDDGTVPAPRAHPAHGDARGGAAGIGETGRRGGSGAAEGPVGPAAGAPVLRVEDVAAVHDLRLGHH